MSQNQEILFWTSKNAIFSISKFSFVGLEFVWHFPTSCFHPKLRQKHPAYSISKFWFVGLEFVWYFPTPYFLSQTLSKTMCIFDFKIFICGFGICVVLSHIIFSPKLRQHSSMFNVKMCICGFGICVVLSHIIFPQNFIINPLCSISKCSFVGLEFVWYFPPSNFPFKTSSSWGLKTSIFDVKLSYVGEEFVCHFLSSYSNPSNFVKSKNTCKKEMKKIGMKDNLTRNEKFEFNDGWDAYVWSLCKR